MTEDEIAFEIENELFSLKPGEMTEIHGVVLVHGSNGVRMMMSPEVYETLKNHKPASKQSVVERLEEIPEPQFYWNPNFTPNKKESQK